MNKLILKAIIPMLFFLGALTELSARDRYRTGDRYSGGDRWNRDNYRGWDRNDNWRYRNDSYQNQWRYRTPQNDRNRDGVITRREWRGNGNSFRRLDRNDDGVISGADRMSPYRYYQR